MKVTIKYLYLGLFFILLLVPALGLLVTKSEHESCENREVQGFPSSYNDTTFFSEVEGSVTDRLLLRNFVNHWGSLVKYKVFNAPMKTDNVIPGKGNWLFYISKGDRIYDSYRHTNLLTEEELLNRKNHWNGINKNLKDKGVMLHLSVWPNKSTIYSEKVPNNLRSQQLDTLSRIDQIIEFLERDKSSIQVLDVREVLLSRKEVQLYKKHDTHWNHYGAFIAYQELIKQLGYSPFQLTDYTIKWETTYKGDLIYLMGVCNDQSVISELDPSFTFKKELDIKKTNDGDKTDVYVNTNAPIDKKVLFFRDSYTSLLVPFMTHQFRECVFVWSGYNEDLVYEHKPDIVEVCPVERYF